MLVLFFNDMGLGYTGMQTLGTVLGIKVMHLKTFQGKESKISQMRCSDTVDIMNSAAMVVRQFYSELAGDGS